MLASPPPAATTAEAAAIAREHFGLDAEAEPLASECDQNFQLRCHGGKAFVLKIANAAEDIALGALQVAALRHVEERDPLLPVPRLRPTRTGAPEASVILASGTRHRARLVTFLDGTVLARVEPSPSQSSALGGALARLGLALRSFRHPAANRDLMWDLQRAEAVRGLLARIAAPELCARAVVVLDRWEAEVAPRLPALRHQIVHNDVNPSNVLVCADDPTRIAGILDFGDLVETALIHDLAIAAAYRVDLVAPLAHLRALAAGYHAVSPLRPEEIDLLFDLICLRQVFTLAIGAWRAALFPENQAYLLRHRPRAAAALAALQAIGPDETRRAFREACGMDAR